MRSRANADWAYSPTGAGGVFSVAPPQSMGTSGYTFPVEKATILDCQYRSATNPGAHAFTAQVSDSFPVDPNFRPAMKMTFGASGKASTCLRSVRSATMESGPWAERATVITRALLPEASIARRARAARLGPIFPVA